MPTLTGLMSQGTFIEPGGNQVAPLISMGSNQSDDSPLLAEYTALRSATFASYLRSMTEDDKYYRLEFGADLIPAEWRSRGFNPTLPPTAYNAVEAARNHILTTPDILVPERPTESDAMREQEIAALKGSALLFFWHQVFKQGDPLGHATKDLIKWGKIVLKKVVDYDTLDTSGVYIGRRRFPWCVTQISPASIFEVGDPYDPAALYEAYETTRSEAERLFPSARGVWRGKDSLDKVRVLEYWEKPKEQSKGRRVIWIDDERVLNKPNPYHWTIGFTDKGKSIYTGYLPYFIGDSGWGDGDTGAAPHERYVGMIRRIHSLLETEARQLTAADAQLRISTFPIINLKGFEEDDEHPIQLGPGAKIHTDEGEEISVVAWPQLDPAVFNIIRQAHSYINELSQFQTLSGIPQSGVDSATEADQNYRAASSKLSGPLAALKSVITRINETVFMDIENVFEAPVTLYGAMDGAPGVVTIEPDWIGGFYENFVELKTSDMKALDAANAVRWANLYSTFGLDKAFAMKMAGIPNPQQRIARRMQEDIWMDPRSHEMRMAASMAGQGGELGSMLSMGVINGLINGVPPEKQAGGSFQAPPMGEPTARDASPDIVPPVEAPYQDNPMRESGFAKVMAARPDLSLRG